ncbi:MAG: hypothetical protein RLZZ462_581 [Bacteroidota bacterium]
MAFWFYVLIIGSYTRKDGINVISFSSLGAQFKVQ